MLLAPRVPPHRSPRSRRRRFSRLIATLGIACGAGGTLRADWRDDCGYTRLLQTFTSDVPSAVAGGIAQIEAPAVADDPANNYLPDPASAAFLGKAFTNLSSGSGASGHATVVGQFFYGNSSSLVGGTVGINAYNANGWIAGDFLNAGTTSLPAVETRRIQNHSWIGLSGNSDSAVAGINQRLDFGIDRDGYLAVVGANNGASTTLPQLLMQGYHSLSVGLTNGQHSAGLTTLDGTGRMKPDLVAFETLTSFATPQVSSAAGLLSEKIRTTPLSPALTVADVPRLTKALLLAGATKEGLPAWSRADTAKPYDAVYGAGALNILLPYRILAGGKQPASGAALVAPTGWNTGDVRRTTAASGRSYFFEVPAGTTDARFSAALTWHRTLTFLSFTGGFTASLPNLDLHLFAVTPGTFTVGTQIDASLSPVDNTEHLYQATLPPGRYALQVTSTSNATTPYALAWRTSPTVTVAVSVPSAHEADGTPGVFTLSRTGPLSSPLLVPLAWGGTALPGVHYLAPPPTVLLPAGADHVDLNVTPITDDLAQGNRSVTLTLASDVSLSVGTAAQAEITLQDKPYDAWRFAHFSAEDLADATRSGASADPDGDGAANLLEYAFAREPLSPETTPAPAPGVDAEGAFTLAYFRPADRTDLSYTVEWTDDLLAAWRSGAEYLAAPVASPEPGGEIISVRSLLPTSTAPLQFLRLRVSLP